MKTLSAMAAILIIGSGASSAHAQSTEEVLGGLIGGSAGAMIGNEIGDGSDEGVIIGAAIGGTLGYVIGGELEDDREQRLRTRYADRPGEYIYEDGRAYRRYRDDEFGYVSFPVYDDDPYYFRDGRKKSHPVFAEHPGQGRGNGLRKRR